MDTTPQWRQLTDHLMDVPEKIYERWEDSVGWDNRTTWGRQFGEDGVSWCVIFNWCMYNETGLAGIVPKVDNVDVFSAWAKKRNQWSDYPSIASWVNFGDGAHTEIIIGFDTDTVYTKGGNSIKTGAADNGQGNGVWRHAHPRRSSYVTGYFAPSFPDSQCPPTADPHDPRGGTASASWRWTPSDPVYVPFPGADFFVLGRQSPIIAAMHTRLAAVGCDRYQSTANQDVWGAGDITSYAAWQRKLGYADSEADGVPGPISWERLQVPVP
ncbi:peptidoglycan-binding protein [Streptomyces goshikiensis]|uniref:peptidoglycan-binding protein n=1 Tax=Streptomyces goshikiensis TaxID=1942 RepID=UPI0036C217C0